MLSRDTEWRQGGILTQASSFSLGMCEKDEADKYLIVISHDCDLPNEKEEEVEVIVGKRIDSVDSSSTGARNVRRLHLSYSNTNTLDEVCIELEHTGRKAINKIKFSELAKQEIGLNLSSSEKSTLKQWLGARYARPAFPNAFESRLQKVKKFHEKFSKILKPINNHLIGIFVDFGEERSIELPPDIPYILRMSLVYRSINGPLAREATENCVNNVINFFHNSFGVPHIATEVALENCQAVANTHFSLADLEKADQWWRYDYISLQESPASPFLPLGAISV